MLHSISIFAAIIGIGFAAAAAMMPETGVDGTPGAFAVLAGTILATVLLLVPAAVRTAPRRALALLAMIVLVVTAVGAWFLMQNALAAVLVAALIAQTAHGASARARSLP
jgi:Na+/melibiose symporter-like transporter